MRKEVKRIKQMKEEIIKGGISKPSRKNGVKRDDY